MPGDPMLASMLVKINGQELAEKMKDSLVDVEVQLDLHMPDVATLRISADSVEDSDLWEFSGALDIGKTVEIEAHAGDESGTKGTIFKGEITSLTLDLDADAGSFVVIQAYDKSHRLHRKSITRTFLKQKYSDIASTIAGEAGLSPQVDATSVTHDYILQSGQTNWEFLSQLAARVGYYIYSADEKLYFKKFETALGEGPELKFGDNLGTFNARLTTAFQESKVIVRGWDHKERKALVGTVAPAKSNTKTDAGGSKWGHNIASAVGGNAELHVNNLSMATQDEAQALATSLARSIANGFVRAEGEGRGNPLILPGYTITISKIGDRFNGKYFVTSVVHRLNSDSGYTTTFSVDGSLSSALSDHLGGDSSSGSSARQGVATATVTNLNDRGHLGRVKVKFPWLGDDIESDWIRIAVPGGGAERGMMFLPEVNDEVLVAFEQGDINWPYVIGGLWNNKDKPPAPTSEAARGGTVNQRIIKSLSGHVIILDDTDGSEKIIIRDKTESNEIIIDSSENTITVNVQGDMTIEAGGKATIMSTGDMSIESLGNLGIKATGNCTIEATGNMGIKGMQMALEGQTTAELKGGVSVSVNSTGEAELKGSLVRIN